MTTRTLAIALLVAVPAAAFAQAQPPAPAPPPVPARSAAVPIVPSVIPVGSRVGILPSGYDDGGRRDPFGSLVTPKRSATPGSIENARPKTGLASLSLADVVVTGISKVGETRLAILAGPNKMSFVARPKDRLYDATVLSIEADGVIFSEQIEGSRATSQVRRSLRPAGEDFR
jgi:hypothetical protein